MKRPRELEKCLLVLALSSTGYSYEESKAAAHIAKTAISDIEKWFCDLSREEAIATCDNEAVERSIRRQSALIKQLAGKHQGQIKQANQATSMASQVKGDDILRHYRMSDYVHLQNTRKKAQRIAKDSLVGKAKRLLSGIQHTKSVELCLPDILLGGKAEFNARVCVERQTVFGAPRLKITLNQIDDKDLLSFVSEVTPTHSNLGNIIRVLGRLEELIVEGNHRANIIADVVEEATGLKYSLAATNVEGTGLSQYYPLFIFQKALENVGTDSPVIPLTSVALSDTDSVLISAEWETLPLAVATAAGIRRSSRAAKTLVNAFSKLPEMHNLSAQFQDLDGQIAEITEQLSLYITYNS